MGRFSRGCTSSGLSSKCMLWVTFLCASMQIQTDLHMYAVNVDFGRFQLVDLITKNISYYFSSDTVLS